MTAQCLALQVLVSCQGLWRRVSVLDLLLPGYTHFLLFYPTVLFVTCCGSSQNLIENGCFI